MRRRRPRRVQRLDQQPQKSVLRPVDHKGGRGGRVRRDPRAGQFEGGGSGREIDGAPELRRQPRLRFGCVAGREFDRLRPRSGEGPESRNAGFAKSFAGHDGCGRSPDEGEADGQNREPHSPYKPRPKPVARQDLRCRSPGLGDGAQCPAARLLARRFGARRFRACSPAKSLVLMTNDADRKGSRALAVEGCANRVVLGAPERGAAR